MDSSISFVLNNLSMMTPYSFGGLRDSWVPLAALVSLLLYCKSSTRKIQHLLFHTLFWFPISVISVRTLLHQHLLEKPRGCQFNLQTVYQQILSFHSKYQISGLGNQRRELRWEGNRESSCHVNILLPVNLDGRENILFSEARLQKECALCVEEEEELK